MINEVPNPPYEHGRTNSGAPLAVRAPVIGIAFDVLWWG